MPSDLEGQYLATPPTLTDGATHKLLLDSAGGLKVASSPVTAGPTTPSTSTSTVAAQSAPVTWQVPVTATPASIAPAWAATTAYVLGQVVTNDSGKVYRCRTAGTSAGSGGPTGTNADITDNTAHWRYIAASTAFKGGAILRNLSTSANTLFYGDSTLAATNGGELPAGQGDVIQAPDIAAIYVVSTSATATVVAYP